MYRCRQGLIMAVSEGPVDQPVRGPTDQPD